MMGDFHSERRFVLPLQYQSQGFDFDQWFQLFTLCLAPLVLHLATGIPEPTILYGDGPGWWDRLPLFSPVSIVWRYLAIADRRCRAKSWDECDMAASNAAFWIRRKWNGSEALLSTSRSWITRKPASTRVHLLSASALSTIGLTAQGVNAVVYVSKGSPEALNMAFYYFALLSLVRMSSAAWLTNDYAFCYSEAPKDEKVSPRPVANHLPSHSQWLMMELPTNSSGTRQENKEGQQRFAETNSLSGRTFRVFWMLITITMFSFSTLGIGRHIFWSTQNRAVTVTAVIERFFAWMIAAGWMGTHGFYVIQGQNTSTLLPCLQHTWYKVYTCSLILVAVLVLAFSSVETHACVSGTKYFYTTYSCDVAHPY